MINKADRAIINVKNNIKHSSCVEQVGELKIISILIEINKCKIKISGLYRCFGYDVKKFIKNLKTYILQNKQVNEHLIIGDTNIDTLINNETTNDYLNILLSNKFIPYINTVTRPNNNNGSCLDHIMVKSRMKYLACKFINRFSDHYPILISCNNKASHEKLLVKKNKL